MNLVKYGRFFGPGGLWCGGLAGLLFLLYPHGFPQHSNLEGVMLVAASLGAAAQHFTDALFFRPVQYYAKLVQLTLLRQYMGARTHDEILRQLTLRYFLGDHYQTLAPSLKDDNRDALMPGNSCKEGST